jgi:hypothetical protein
LLVTDVCEPSRGSSPCSTSCSGGNCVQEGELFRHCHPAKSWESSGDMRAAQSGFQNGTFWGDVSESSENKIRIGAFNGSCRSRILVKARFRAVQSSLRPGSSSVAGSYDGRLAQLVRAPALQAGGRRFESCTAHHLFNNLQTIHERLRKRSSTSRLGLRLGQ